MGRFVVMLQLSILIIISLFVCLFSIWLKPKESIKAMGILIGEFFDCLNIFVNKSKENEYESIDFKKHLSETWSALNVDWSTLFQWGGSAVAICLIIWVFNGVIHKMTASGREDASIQYIIVTNEDVLNGDYPISSDVLIYNPEISYNSETDSFVINYVDIDEDYCEDLFDAFVSKENPNFRYYYNPIWTEIIINKVEFVNRKQKNKNLACKEENDFSMILNREESSKEIKTYLLEKKSFSSRAKDLNALIKENTYLRNSYDNFVKKKPIVPTKNNPFNRNIDKSDNTLVFNYPQWNKEQCVDIIKDQIGLTDIKNKRYGSYKKNWSEIHLNNEIIIKMEQKEDYDFREYIMEDLCLESNVVKFKIHIEEEVIKNKEVLSEDKNVVQVTLYEGSSITPTNSDENTVLDNIEKTSVISNEK